MANSSPIPHSSCTIQSLMPAPTTKRVPECSPLPSCLNPLDVVIRFFIFKALPSPFLSAFQASMFLCTKLTHSSILSSIPSRLMLRLERDKRICYREVELKFGEQTQLVTRNVMTSLWHHHNIMSCALHHPSMDFFSSTDWTVLCARHVRGRVDGCHRESTEDFPGNDPS